MHHSTVRGHAYLSIPGIMAMVRVVGVGNKVECGVILEEGTCVQQRAGMLSTWRMGWTGGGVEGLEAHLPRLFEFLATRVARRTAMEGAIVFRQRALGAEPAAAGAVATIKIFTRTECHCACPKGTTSKGERGTLSGRHDSARLL